MTGEQTFMHVVDPWFIFQRNFSLERSSDLSLDVSEGPSYPVELDDKSFTVPTLSLMERPTSPSESVSEESVSVHSEESFTDDDDDWQKSDELAQHAIPMILRMLVDQTIEAQLDGQQGKVNKASGGGGGQPDVPEDPPQEVEQPESDEESDDGEYDEEEDVPVDPEQGELEVIDVNLDDFAEANRQIREERVQLLQNVARDVAQMNMFVAAYNNQPVQEVNLAFQPQIPVLAIQHMAGEARVPEPEPLPDFEPAEEEGYGENETRQDREAAYNRRSNPDNLRPAEQERVAGRQDVDVADQEEASEQIEIHADHDEQPHDPPEPLPQPSFPPSNRKRPHERNDEDDANV